MPRMCPLSAFNGENREIKLCWIWCCLLQTTWAENQRHKSHPRPFVASWIINTPADEQPCGKESPCELHICKRNLGKETLGKSPSTQESSLRLRCLSAMQPTLKNEGEKEEKKRKKKKNFPPAAYTYYDQQRKCKCVWAQSCTSFERGEQIPNALVNCVNHPSHPSRSESSNPHTYAHLTAKPPPQHSFSSFREITRFYSHVAASASVYLSPACARAPVAAAAAAAAAAFSVASETNLHRQRWFSSGLLCLRFPRWTPTRLCHYPSSIAPPTQARLWGCHLPPAGLLVRETTDLKLTTDHIKTLQGMATQDYRSNTLACNDTMHRRSSSVFSWHCEPDQVEETLFMNLQLPEWLQVKPYGHH